MSPRERAAQDQRDAKERDFDRKAQRVAGWFLLAFALFAVYAVLAAMGVLPAMPWSPLGDN